MVFGLVGKPSPRPPKGTRRAAPRPRFQVTTATGLWQQGRLSEAEPLFRAAVAGGSGRLGAARDGRGGEQGGEGWMRGENGGLLLLVSLFSHSLSSWTSKLSGKTGPVSQFSGKLFGLVRAKPRKCQWCRAQKQLFTLRLGALLGGF